ncbi:MAG: hypothetical protein NZ937_01590 [Armatimonadetes bacterium]|nr:hypothetical protein [Armatimonadota bacterium]
MRKWSLVVVLSTICFSHAFAQQTPSDVTFGGEYFFRFRTSAGGLSNEERAATLQSRLTQVFTRIIAQGAKLEVSVRSKGATKLIFVAGVPFVTVTQNDALANQTKVEHLTKVWLGNIKQGLALILGQR